MAAGAGDPARRCAATFFLAGEQVVRFPSLAAEIVAAGHRVELHCHRHRNQLRLSGRALLDDADRARSAIEEASGRESPTTGSSAARSARPASGSKARGWRPVLWSQWGKGLGAHVNRARSTARARSEAGDILLLHDADYYSAPGSWARTVAALPAILEELEARGLRSRLLRR